MNTQIAVLLFCLAALVLQSANAQIVTNGTFDTPVPLNGTGGGWTTANLDGAGGHRSTDGNPGGFFILNAAGAIGSDPTIQQTLTDLAVGATYELTGDYRTVYIYGSSGAPAFAASIDGVAVFEAFSSVSDWTSFSGTFVAPDSSASLSFAAEMNGSDLDFGIDNITVTIIPEPATVAVAVGLMSLALVILRRRLGRR